MSDHLATSKTSQEKAGDDGISIMDLLVILIENKWKLLLLPCVSGLLAFGASYLIQPTFTARTVIIPPSQQQSAATAALQSLGALAGLAGAGASVKNPIDQYLSLMQSNTISDRVIDKFKLQSVYGARLKQDARRALTSRVAMSIGKKDGLVTIEVDDTDPQRAAAIANNYVEQLRKLTNELAMTEAQQRRAFFEKHLQDTKQRLSQAQRALEVSGIGEGSLRAEPRTMAETYASLKARVTATQAQLQLLSQGMTPQAHEIKQLTATLEFMRKQLRDVESARSGSMQDTDYVASYREFKYQETLFELFARQYEAAKLDESREGAFVQVVDPAGVPEHKSKPKRLQMAVMYAVAALGLTIIFVFVREGFRITRRSPNGAKQFERLKRAWRP